MRYAVPAARKPGVAFHGHPFDACVSPMATRATHALRPSDSCSLREHRKGESPAARARFFQVIQGLRHPS